MNDGDKKVKINTKGLIQPQFRYQPGTGVQEYVSADNDKYRVGDRIPKPKRKNEDDSNSNGSGGGDSQDNFEFTITKNEFLDVFFEDLELPNLKKKDIAETQVETYTRSGFTVDGSPSRLNIMRTMRYAMGRRMALRTPKKRKIKELMLEQAKHEVGSQRYLEIEEEIIKLRKKIKSIPYIDDIDLRYHFWEKKPKPTTKAVLFGLLDVSGSMGEHEKEIAKRFFILALLFLKRKYEKVDIVWIRHTDTAKEVNEQEFFYAKESGSTVISSALKLMHQIQKERYPSDVWNVYGIQITDGDNYAEDNPTAIELLEEKILPISQYFAYVEVHTPIQMSAHALMANFKASANGALFNSLYALIDKWSQFSVSLVYKNDQIYPAFRKLFKKRPK